MPSLSYPYINKYFFVRYYDTDFHIRVRVNIDLNNKDAKEYLFRMYSVFDNFKKEGLIKRIELEEYIAEVERYGGAEVMRDVEYIFMLSSLIAMREIKENEENKWLEEKYYRFVLNILLNINNNISDSLDIVRRYERFYSRDKDYDLLKRIFLSGYFSGSELYNTSYETKEIINVLRKIKLRISKVKIGINRKAENKVNGLVENTIYSLTNIKIKKVKM